jgi:uncharacterized protein (DUF885 family)
VTARELGKQFWDGLVTADPLLGAQMGDDRYPDRLPDLSRDGVEQRRDLHRSALARSRELRNSVSGRWDRLILDSVEAISGPALDAIDLGLYWFAPIDQLFGPGTLLDQLATLQQTTTDDLVDRYLDRLSLIDWYLEAAGTLLRDAPGNRVAPRIIVERCIRQIDELLAIPPSESVALRPIPQDKQLARSTALGIVRRKILPAYERYRRALHRYHRRARESIGLGDLPSGSDLYAVAIRQRTSAPLDPREVHELGLEELAAVQGERAALAKALGAEDPEQAIASYGRSDSARFSSREEIVHVALDQARRAFERAASFFGRLPAATCDVRAIDPSREDDVLEHYYPGTSNGSRPGIYYVNTARPQERLRHTLASTTFHETTPGHHLQMSLSMEEPDRPELLRFASELSGLSVLEGWGLYAERLADEMGLYADRYEQLGMLENQALRAARLVVDTGIHALNWERSRVISTLVGTGLPQDQAIIETDRYIAMPGQALSYKIGQLEIEDLRRSAQRTAAQSFALSDFHDAVMSLGAVPLTSFRREMEVAMTASQQTEGAVR